MPGNYLVPRVHVMQYPLPQGRRRLAGRGLSRRGYRGCGREVGRSYKCRFFHDWIPIWRGVPVKEKDVYRTKLTNINLRYANVGFPTKKLTHATIIDSPGVQKMMLHAILDACQRWQTRHPRINIAIRGRRQDKMAKVPHNSSP